MSGRRIEFYRHAVGDDELASLRETVGGVFLSLGPRVAEFERAFAALTGAPHVVGVSSCSMGLVLALRALGVGPGDEVITTPMSFVATPNAVLHTGASYVFADVERSTGLLDPAKVEAAIGPRTKAIVAVHLYGQLCDMRALRAVADKHGLALVEDAAHAVEAERDGVRTAELGDLTTYSFYTTKNLTSGDGGAVAARDAALAERVRKLRNHAVTKGAADRHGALYEHWDVTDLGFKATMTDVEAALLLPQLRHVSERRARRQALVERYEALLADVPGVELFERSGKSGHHLFATRLPADVRDAVLVGLGRRGVGVAVNYRAIHTLTYYRERFAHRPEDFPAALEVGARTVSLPLYPTMPQRDVDDVVTALREALAEVGAA